MKKDFEYIQQVNQNFSGNITKRSGSIVTTLTENGFNYPHIISVVNLDSIKADNMVEFKKQMNILTAKLSSKLAEGMKPESEFVRHLGFTDIVKGSKIKYTPFTIDLEDGQRIIALARQYTKDESKIDLTAPFEVAKWFLNEENITASIHLAPKPKDSSTIAKRLSSIVIHNHKKFVAENPEKENVARSEVLSVENEIVGTKIDLSDVVFDAKEEQGGKVSVVISYEDRNDDTKEFPDYDKAFDYYSDMIVEAGNPLEKITEVKLIDGENVEVGFRKKSPKEVFGDMALAWINDTDAKIQKEVGAEKYKEWFDERRFSMQQTGSEKVRVKNNASGDENEYSTREFLTDEEVKALIEDVIEIAKDRKDREPVNEKLIKTAEFVKAKTGVDYEIKHNQAHFIVGDKELDIDEYNSGAEYFTNEGAHAGESIKERWLGLVNTRKNAIERILKNLEQVKGKEPHVDKSEELTAELQQFNPSLKIVPDGKEYMVTEVDGDEKLVIEGDEARIREFIAEAKRIKDRIGDIRFGAGHMGGVDTVLWDRTKEEDGDYKRVGVIDKGIAKIKPDYQDDEEAIEYAKSMGATSFEHLESPEITAENIAEFYPAMSDEELIENKKELTNIFVQRYYKIFDALGLTEDQLEDNNNHYAKIVRGDRILDIASISIDADEALVGQEYFGVKDNLQPIDEYVAEIKASEAYKAYASPSNKQSPLEQILNDETYKQIVKDSFGGVMYDVSNQYDASHLLDLWGKMSEAERSASGGTMKGAMNFLKEQGVTPASKADFTAQLAEFQTLTDADLDRADTILEEVEKAISEYPTDENLKAVYEQMNEQLNKIAGF